MDEAFIENAYVADVPQFKIFNRDEREDYVKGRIRQFASSFGIGLLGLLEKNGLELSREELDPFKDLQFFRFVISEAIANSIDAYRWSQDEFGQDMSEAFIHIHASIQERDGQKMLFLCILDLGPGFASATTLQKKDRSKNYLGGAGRGTVESKIKVEKLQGYLNLQENITDATTASTNSVTSEFYIPLREMSEKSSTRGWTG